MTMATFVVTRNRLYKVVKIDQLILSTNKLRKFVKLIPMESIWVFWIRPTFSLSKNIKIYRRIRRMFPLSSAMLLCFLSLRSKTKPCRNRAVDKLPSPLSKSRWYSKESTFVLCIKNPEKVLQHELVFNCGTIKFMFCCIAAS